MCGILHVYLKVCGAHVCVFITDTPLGGRASERKPVLGGMPSESRLEPGPPSFFAFGYHKVRQAFSSTRSSNDGFCGPWLKTREENDYGQELLHHESEQNFSPLQLTF